MSPEVDRDPGMQQERTTLAWRRTGLSLLVGSLTIGRLTLDTIGAAVVIPTALPAVLALWIVAVLLGAGRRPPAGGDRAHRGAARGRRGHLGGAPPHGHRPSVAAAGG